MTKRAIIGNGLTGVGLALALAFPARAQVRPADAPVPKASQGAAGAPNASGTRKHAGGSFDVKLTPLPAESRTDRPAFARLVFDKVFHGDFEGTSQGEMMSVDTAVQGSGAYVAVERLNGTLRGRKGAFAVVHRGTMRRGGDFDMVVTVVPDSGTGQLAGLAGTMKIIIAEGGKHLYEIDYTLPEAP